MYKLILVSSISLAILLLFLAPAYAYFKDLGVGARPAGMGGAYVAVADDGNAVLWNSAGLGQINRQEITAMFSALYAGLGAKLYNEKIDQLGYHFISYVYPSELGGFALSWSTFQSQLYDENTFCLSYGTRISENIYTGVSLKNSGWSVGGNEFTYLDRDIPDSGVSMRGSTMDIGMLLKPVEGISLGFSAENLIPADIGLNTEENIPVNLRGGIAFRFDRPIGLDMSFLATSEITYRVYDEADFRTGAESWFLDKILGLRVGLNSNSAASGFSYCIKSREWELQVDYAFTYPFYIQDNNGSHRISISLRF